MMTLEHSSNEPSLVREAAGLVLIGLATLFAGPLLLRGAFDYSGRVRWTQLGVALCGTLLWVVVLWMFVTTYGVPL